MKIETYGTAFTSYDVKASKLNKEEISKENISINSEIKKTNEMENISYHTTTKSASAKFTVFKDPTNDKYVVSSLNNSTIDKLKTQFSEDNFIEKEDGSLRLTGEAEAFVSGWFADIAYKREFLESDTNDDGQISENEYKNVRNSYISEANTLIRVDGTTEKIAYFGENITEQYVTVDEDDITYRQHKNSEDLPTTLDNELNMTLKLDKNFDGVMTLTESYLETNELKLDTVMADLKSIGETAEPLINSEMGLIDILIVEAFDKFVQLPPDERKEQLSKVLEELSLERKSKQKEKDEIALEKHIQKLIEDKKFDEEVQTNGLEIHV